MAYELNDLARQLGNPIYDETDPESTKTFADLFEKTEAGQKFFSMFGADTVEAAWDLAIAKFKKVNGDDEITLGDFTQFVNALILSGGLQKPAPPAPPEKKLSPSQQKWSEYRIYSEEHTMAQCKARAQQDPGYASFMHKNLEREAAEQSPTDLINLNANRTPATKVSPDLAHFVEDYKTMPIQKVRMLSNAGTNPGGSVGAAHWNSLFSKATELGLI
jgi:hypothetical protein